MPEKKETRQALSMAKSKKFNEQQKKAARPRALKIRAMRKTKPPTTWKEIGEEFGITKQRAQQIYNQHFKEQT